jgi:hypothetical protein
MNFPGLTSEPTFAADDLGSDPGDVARRARVAKGWMDDIVLSDVRNKDQRAFVMETRVRLKEAGDATVLTERQFYYLKGIWERATGDESGEVW